MTNFSKVFFALIGAICLTNNANAKPNVLFTLENLERQRAILLGNLTNQKLSAYQRKQKTNKLIKRLVDMERMVLRDERIAGSHSIMAKNAFQNYELTFLVHAGSESKKSPMAHWLHTLKITNQSIEKTKAGVR